MKPENIKNNWILWADDDVDDLLIIRDVLATFDHKPLIKEAHNGQQVLQYLDKINDPALYPSLIVLDMNMPVLDGRGTLKHLKAEPKYSDIPVLIMTTSHSEMDRMYCKRLGVEMYTKPDSFKGYRETIQNLLHLCSTEQEKYLGDTRYQK